MKIPYNKSLLSDEAQAVLKSKSSVYAKATALTQLVESGKGVNVDTLLCLADLEMGCARSTEFEEDTIDFGGNAVVWLEKALQTDPEKELTEAIEKSMDAIRKKVAKAEKRANAILKYEKDNLDEMHPVYLDELAYYYFCRCEKSSEFANKGYTYYKYIYDREKTENPDSHELLYYWQALTLCKFEASGYEGAKTEVEQLIGWELKPYEQVYRVDVTNGYWIKLYHFSETNNLAAFRALYNEWYARMVLPEKSGKPPYIYLLRLLNPLSEWLLQQEGTEEYLAYILENGYKFFNNKVLDEQHIAVMKRIEKRLQA